MKIIYKTLVLLLSVSALNSSANAQTAKDTTLNRQVSVERAFTPIIQDATKINTMPEVETYAPSGSNVKYVTQLPQIEFSTFSIKDLGSGDAATAIDFSKQRGYFIAGVGHNINLDGRFGYRFIDTDADRLDFFASYNAANSDIDYLNQDYLKKSVKAKKSDAYAKLKYRHSFEPSILSVNASFFNTMYNYYGNSFVQSESFLYNLDKQQSVNIFGTEAEIKSKEELDFSYIANFKFHNFGNKYGVLVNDKGTGGNIFEGNVGVGATFDTDKKVDLEFGALHQKYNKIKFGYNPGAFDALTSLKARALFGMEGSNWKVRLGANMHYAIDLENKFIVAPELHATLTFADKNTLYADVTGGINDNTFLDILLENRYVTPSTRIGYSTTLYDATLGFKIGAVEGIEFDVFGGYKHTQDDHVYSAINGGAWGNISAPIYANISEGNLGASVKSSLIPYTNLSFGANYYFYSVKYVDDRYNSTNLALVLNKKEAFGRPQFVLNVGAEVKPITPLTLMVSYNLQTGRKGFNANDDAVESMKNINELNFRTEYQFLDWFSANLAFNNILNQKYESLLGYTHQGFNVMAGVSLKF